MKIPFVDLKAQYESIKEEIDEAIARCLLNSSFVGGVEVKTFEKQFASYIGVDHCVSCGNGTDAIEMVLRALGVGPGDEVITPSHTFVAAVEAIVTAGATPVFVEIDSETMLMQPSAAEAAISDRTKALLPVHLYGQPCDMDAMTSLARKHGLLLIEDAAQAHGARWNGQKVGTFGDAACFSFYPGKNLGAYGDGGAVVTRNAELAHDVRMMANHGRTEKYRHERIGRNNRLDSIQAAVLGAKLNHLDSWNAARRDIAARYSAALAGKDVTVPTVDDAAEPVWHLYVVRTVDRDRYQKELDAVGVSTQIHYPLPAHLQPAFIDNGRRAGDLSITEEAAATVLSLPMYAELPTHAVDLVAKAF